MQRNWKGGILWMVMAAMLVPALAVAEPEHATAPAVQAAPAVTAETGEPLCPATPEPLDMTAVPPNQPSSGPCQVQFTCPSPRPGVLGMVVGCSGDIYCTSNPPYYVECDYSRSYCN